jgi:hypothetical protein
LIFTDVFESADGSVRGVVDKKADGKVEVIQPFFDALVIGDIRSEGDDIDALGVLESGRCRPQGFFLPRKENKVQSPSRDRLRKSGA